VDSHCQVQESRVRTIETVCRSATESRPTGGLRQPKKSFSGARWGKYWQNSTEDPRDDILAWDSSTIGYSRGAKLRDTASSVTLAQQSTRTGMRGYPHLPAGLQSINPRYHREHDVREVATSALRPVVRSSPGQGAVYDRLRGGPHGASAWHPLLRPSGSEGG
jgi:hypothetical protein